MSSQSYDLVQLARQTLIDHGLQPDLPPAAVQELETIKNQPIPLNINDLRNFIWCSIDNDDSRDLDQLTYATKSSAETTTLFIAIAEVDALVPKNSPIDQHAQINTTSIYTPVKIFPMLPEKLSTNLTSLNENEDRLAIVIEIAVTESGEITGYSFYQALVKNHAKLTYNGVGDWLEGKGPLPPKISEIRGLEENIRLQSHMAQILKNKRILFGALTLQTPESAPLILYGKVVGMTLAVPNLATELIENFMIAANAVIATILSKSKFPSLRRVVRTPKNWDRIVELAAENGENLPQKPDSIALDHFLAQMKKKDPQIFLDLSLSVVKLLGSGEYIVEMPGQSPVGHFGLALREYTHSTAPNRRYPDLITQRQLKALLKVNNNPYDISELNLLAEHCTKQEDAATKVERQMNKSAAALLLSSHIGEEFQGIITGASDKGTWIRIFNPPTEGKIVGGYKKLDVGDKIKVKLISVDIAKGYIDFIKP